MTLENGEIEIPRWLQVPIGLILGFLIILIGLASLALFLTHLQEHPILSFAAGIVLLLGCLWVLEKCIRLVTGRKKQGGLMSPGTLYLISWVILVIPVAGIFTGYYREMRLVAIVQAGAYLIGFFGLRSLAQKRESQARDQANPDPLDSKPVD
jgi:hypothetical protein